MRKGLLKLSSICLSLLLTIGLGCSNVFASEINLNEVNSNIEKEGTITVSDSDFDTMIKTGEPVYLGNMTWAKIVTFDEMVTNVAKSKGISELEEKNQLLSSKLNITSAATEATSFYVHFYEQFQVQNTGWYPQIDIYAECQGVYRDFVGISDLNMIRSYNYISKQYTGKLQAKVENSKTIYWVVNGDFYDNGTTSWTFGGSVNIGEYATLTGSISGANNLFGYAYKTGYIQNR